MSGLKFPISPETWALLRQHPEFYESINTSGKRVGLLVRPEDAEAQTHMEQTPDGKKVVKLILPVDDDANPENGRYYLEDRFFFDDGGSAFLKWDRKLINPGAKDPELQHWLKFQEILIAGERPTNVQAETFGRALWPTLPRPTLANQGYWQKLRESKEALAFVTQIGSQAQSIDPFLQLQGYVLDSHYNSQESNTEISYVQRWILDQDRYNENGRIVVEDRFVTDKVSGELTDFKRSYQVVLDGEGSQVISSGNPEGDRSSKFAALPSPSLAEAKAYFEIMGPQWNNPIVLQKLHGSTGKINDLPKFFSDFDKKDVSYLQDMVFAARTANPELSLKSQGEENTYSVQYLGDRIELTLTWLLADYQDANKNQVLCRDSFLVSAKNSRILNHERFFTARRKTWEDKSVLSAFNEVSGTSHSPPVGAKGFLEKVLPKLLPVSIDQTEAVLAHQSGPRALQIPSGYQAPIILELRAKTQPPKKITLLYEGMGLMEDWAKVTLAKEVSAGKSWSPWAQPVDSAAELTGLQDLWSAWHYEIRTPTSIGLKSALQQIDEEKISPVAKRWRHRLLNDPSALTLMDALEETDLNLRDEALLVLAREKFIKSDAMPEVALALAEVIAKRESKRSEARDLLAFFGGGGSVGLQSDLLGAQFIDHVLDESMVVAMMGAGVVGSAMELNGLLAFGKLGRMGRWGATGIGIGSEAAAFTTLANTVRSFQSDPDVAFAHWGRETLSAGVLFSLFRLGHGFTAWGATRLTGSRFAPLLTRQPATLIQGVSPALLPAGALRLQLNGPAEFLLSGSNFIWGVEAMYLSGEISRFLGWAPETTAGLGQKQFKALTDYLGAMIGYRFANGLTGGHLNQGIANLRQRSISYREQMKAAKSNSIKLPPENRPPDLPEIKEEKVELEVSEPDLLDTEIIVELPREPMIEPLDKIPTLSPVPITYNLEAARDNILSGEFGHQGIPRVEQEFSGLGRWWGMTEEGVGYGNSKKGKALNQDALAWSQGPDGSVFIFNLDGMGGHAHGKEAALLAAHHLVSGVKEGRMVPDILFAANEAIRKNYLGSGAVFGGVKLSPSGNAQVPVRTEMFWAGDIRILVARKDTTGQYRWIYRNIEEAPATELADLRIEKGDLNPVDRSLVISLDPFKHLVSNHLGNEAFSFQTTENGFFPNAKTVYRSAEGHDVLHLKEGDVVATFSDGIIDSVVNTKELLDFFNRNPRPEQGLAEAHAESRYKMRVLDEARRTFKEYPNSLFAFRYQGHVPEWQGRDMYVNSDGHFLDAPEGGQLYTLSKPDNISLSVFEIQSGVAGLHRANSESKRTSRPRSSKTPVFGSGILGTLNQLKDAAPRDLPAIPALPKFPEGKLPPFLRIGQVDVEYTQKKVMAWLRAQAIQADRDSMQRNMPSAPPQNSITLELKLNLGDILQDPLLEKFVYHFPLEVFPGQNRMAIPQLYRDALHEQRLVHGDPKARAVLEVLENLHRAHVHPQVPQVGPETKDSNLQLIVIPEANPNIFRHNKGVLKKTVGEVAHYEREQHSWQGGFTAKEFLYHEGEIFMDSAGKIMACDLRAPKVENHFGEPQKDWLKVPVIVFGDTVVWTVRMDGMNSRQISELMALTEGAAEIHRSDPYGVDVVRGKQDGPLVGDLVNILNEFNNIGPTDVGSFQIHLVEQQGVLRAYSTLFAGPMTKNLKSELGTLPARGHVVVHLKGDETGNKKLGLLEYISEAKGPDTGRIQKILQYIMGQRNLQ